MIVKYLAFHTGNLDLTLPSLAITASPWSLSTHVELQYFKLNRSVVEDNSKRPNQNKFFDYGQFRSCTLPTKHLKGRLGLVDTGHD